MEIIRHPAGPPVPEEDDPVATPVDARAVSTVPGLRLTAVEKLAVESLVKGRPGETASFVSSRAAALAADELGEVRRRSLAKAFSLQEAVTAQLTALLVEAVARRDNDAVKMLDRALSGSTQRMQLLAAELRADFAGNKKTPVQIGVIANNVNITGGK